jgi:Zn-finger nucleic acid-binding protein
MTGTGDGLRCPRCGRLWWPGDDGGFAARCPSCGGTFLQSHEVEQILGAELGYSIGDLRAAARAPAVDRGGCPSCGGELYEGKLEEASVELCTRCGSAWLDPGELEQLSHGRHLEARPPSEQAREHLPVAVAPNAGKRYVRVPPISIPRQVIGGISATTGLLGLAFAPLAVFAVPGLLIAHQKAVILDTERRAVASVTSMGFNFRSAWRPWSQFDEVVVYGKTLRRTPQGSIVRWSPHLVDSEEQHPPLPIGHTRDRVLAHRWAFQVSQLTGLRVRTPEAGQR